MKTTLLSHTSNSILGTLVTLFICSAAAAQPPVIYDPALYTALEVFARDAFSPSINNNGEIAYAKQIPGSPEPRIFTTLQGDVTVPGTLQVRFPAINDLGEVVYSAITGPGGFHVFSSTRGRLTPHLFRGNLPSINNLSVVAFKNDGVGTGGAAGIYTTADGISHTAVVLDFDANVPKINDAGEIAYARPDGIYTIAPGGIPQLRVPGAQSPGFNNHGDIVYSKQFGSGRFLFGPGDVQLAPYPIGVYLDLNDHGDIVIQVFSVVNGIANFNIVLLTQHPQDFPYPLFVFDSDGDGIPDDQDDCPEENPQGADADGDGCIDRPDDLASVIADLGIPLQLENALTNMANNAAAAAAMGNLTAAANMLNAFINAVNAQRGKKLSEAEADLLAAFAQNAAASL